MVRLIKVSSVFLKLMVRLMYFVEMEVAKIFFGANYGTLFERQQTATFWLQDKFRDRRLLSLEIRKMIFVHFLKSNTETLLETRTYGSNCFPIIFKL